MFRRALAMYLVLMTAAGPHLCCCSTHLFAKQTETAACCKDRQPIPEPHSCCQSTDTTTIKVGTAKPSEDTPRPGPEQCPCRKNATTPVTVVAVEQDGRDQSLSSPHAFLTTLDLAASGFIPTDFTRTHTPQSPAHFLCGEQILYVFHQLNC